MKTTKKEWAIYTGAVILLIAAWPFTLIVGGGMLLLCLIANIFDID